VGRKAGQSNGGGGVTELHIEHLVLNGLDLNRTRGLEFQEVLEAELTRLLEAGGLEHLRDGITIPTVFSRMTETVPDVKARGFGEDVARAVYDGVTQREVKP
jgi:hypothetical protein